MKFIRALFQLHDINHCLTNNTWRIKNLEEEAIERDKELKELDHDFNELRDYTKILNGRISKLSHSKKEKEQ